MKGATIYAIKYKHKLRLPPAHTLQKHTHTKAADPMGKVTNTKVDDVNMMNEARSNDEARYNPCKYQCMG